MKLKLKWLSCLVLSVFPFVWAQAEIHTMIDPSNGRTVFVDGAGKIDGCDAGLVRFEIGYVCRSRIPPRPAPQPTPPPVYPPADAVCKGEYLRPEMESCASGYVQKKYDREGDIWCIPTAQQVALCTPYYPPAPPDPGPGHDFGHQIGYMGPDGQLHETKDPNSAICSGCKNEGETDSTDKELDQPDPNDNSTDGPVGNPGGIGGE